LSGAGKLGLNIVVFLMKVFLKLLKDFCFFEEIKINLGKLVSRWRLLMWWAVMLLQEVNGRVDGHEPKTSVSSVVVGS